MMATRELDVVMVSAPADIKRFDRMLADEHWLGSGQPVGHYLRQAFEQNGEYVLQVKGNQPALYKLAQSRRDRAPFLPSPKLSADALSNAASVSSPSTPAKPACPTAGRS